MVHQLHDGMKACVTDNRTVSEAFAVTSAVRQICVLVPNLFGFMFSVTQIDAYRDERPGIRIANRTDKHPLNSRCIQASTRLSTTTVYDLLFVDDCALNTETGAANKWSMNLFAPSCANFGLTINNTDKTAVMNQPPPNAAYSVPRTHFNGTQLKTVDKFANLGNTLMPSQNRRRSRSTDLQRQPGLPLAAEVRVESPRSSPRQQTQDVQNCHLDGVVVWCGGLDSLPETSAETQPLPPQLFPPDTNSEVAGQDPQYGGLVTDWNPQYPRYSEATATTMERPPREDGR
ncbi:hypothetical protein SprV_0200581800 [Sparganum proliferum]